MAITANGMIATEKDEVPHVSKKSWKSYANMVGKIGNLIVGRKTFELMQDNPIPKCNVCVITKNKSKFKKLPKRICFAKNPIAALRRMKQEGFDEVLVGGRSKLNAAFLKEGLVDEIYLDVEPHILGKGKPLFFPHAATVSHIPQRISVLLIEKSESVTECCGCSSLSPTPVGLPILNVPPVSGNMPAAAAAAML